VRLVDRDARWKRDRDAQLVAGKGEMADRRERLWQGAGPLIELHPVGRARTNRQVQRQLALLGNTDLVGAGEPMRFRPDRHNAARLRRHLEPDEYRIILLVNVIHQARDLEATGEGVAQGPRREPRRKLPLYV